MQECLSEFILFVTSEAQELTKEKGYVSLNGQFMLHALKKLGFDSYFPLVMKYGQKYYRANQLQKRHNRSGENAEIIDQEEDQEENQDDVEDSAGQEIE